MQMQAGESQAQLACVKAAAAAATATNAQHDSTVSPLVNYEEIIANHPSVHESEFTACCATTPSHCNRKTVRGFDL